LRLVQHGFVVHDFQAAWRVLAGSHKVLFGFIELVQFAVNLGDSQIDVGIVGHQIGKLFVDLQSFGIFFFGKEGLPQAALVAGLGRIEFRCLAVGVFRLGQVMGLGVRIAQKIQQDSRGRVCGDAFEQGHRFGGLTFVHKQLGQLLDGRLVFRIGVEDGFQDLLGLVVFILQAIEARQPEGRFGV
jgi:hypothetical protein